MRAKLKRLWMPWIVAAVVLIAGTAVAATVYVKTRYATVRDGKTSRSAVVSKATRGQALEVVSKDGGFYQVKLPDGKTGWISRIWVSNSKPSSGNSRLERLGKMARKDGGGDVSVSAGARGLSPQAKQYADAKDAAEAAKAVVRMEQVRVTDDQLDAFMKAGGLGPYRGGTP